jgi:hypothetical protein
MEKTIFSSNLVQSAGSEGSDQTTTVALSRDFWKFIVFSLCLMIATLLLAIGWRLGWRRFWPILRRKLKLAASEI